MPEWSSARLGLCRIIGRLVARDKGFALQVDQFLARRLALGLDGIKLGIRLRKLRTQLDLFSKQVGEYTTEVIALGTDGVQLRAHGHQFGLQ
jgi:hypothetical protein